MEHDPHEHFSHGGAPGSSGQRDPGGSGRSQSSWKPWSFGQSTVSSDHSWEVPGSWALSIASSGMQWATGNLKKHTSENLAGLAPAERPGVAEEDLGPGCVATPPEE